MIIADTSVWVEHLRKGSPRLAQALEAGGVLIHPFIIGEIALGHLQRRKLVLDALAGMPQAVVASSAQVLSLIERHALQGKGVGYVDVQILASAGLSAARIWTHDRRLGAVASALGLAADPQ